jgi:hypothetical protein
VYRSRWEKSDTDAYDLITELKNKDVWVMWLSAHYMRKTAAGEE